MAKKTTSDTSSSKAGTPEAGATPEDGDATQTNDGSDESTNLTNQTDPQPGERPEMDAGAESKDEVTPPRPGEDSDDFAGATDEAADTDNTTEDSTANRADESEAQAAPSDGQIAEAPVSPPVTTEQVVIRKGGFVPMILGGVAAAAIGFGAGYYTTSQGWLPGDGGIDELRSETERRLQEQADRMADLSARIDAAAQGSDLSQVEQEQSDLSATVTAFADRLDAAERGLAELTDRVATMEARPLSEGASEAAVAAYEAELKKLQDAMAEQRAEIRAMTEEARAMEANAEETAQATMRRAALSRIQTALDAGGDYADALADLEATGTAVPEVLAASAETGVPTLAELQARFPDAARAALAAARTAAAEAGETGGWAAFLRTQLGVRSLEPRKGNDPDAILSRAEAATREGRLTDALAEIEALPETARAELSDWAGQARQRLDAIAAAQALGEELN